MQLLRIKFKITNRIKGREVKIGLKEEYTNSVFIWKFQKRINKFKDDLLILKLANEKKPEMNNLNLKSKVDMEVIQ